MRFINTNRVTRRTIRQAVSILNDHPKFDFNDNRLGLITLKEIESFRNGATTWGYFEPYTNNIYINTKPGEIPLNINLFQLYIFLHEYSHFKRDIEQKITSEMYNLNSTDIFYIFEEIAVDKKALLALKILRKNSKFKNKFNKKDWRTLINYIRVTLVFKHLMFFNIMYWFRGIKSISKEVFAITDEFMFIYQENMIEFIKKNHDRK